MVRPLLCEWTKNYLISPTDDSCSITELKTKLNDFVVEEFFASDTNIPTTADLASFFDPRYKNLDHQNSECSTRVKKTVKEMLTGPQVEVHISSAPKRLKLEEIYQRKGGHESDLDVEFNAYLAEKQIDFDLNPYKWWKYNEPKYPLIAKLAKKYMCIPASVFLSAQDNVNQATANSDIMFLYNNKCLLQKI